MAVNLTLGGEQIPLDRDVFVALFQNSVVNDRAPIRHALEKGSMPYVDFITLARHAEIPYPLFFAPMDVVQAQLKMKTDKLMAGFTQRDFSMNSRNQVHLSDVELIVKDLIRKQQHLRDDATLGKNRIIGLLQRSRGTVAEDARTLMSAIGMSTADIREAKNKKAALELLIARLEAKQILVARSAKNYMPQQMPKRAKFSGMTIKDTKVPYVFLATGDEGEHLEPTGRKIFTLTLMLVLIANGTFAPVTYDGHTTDETSGREYELTAQILMPTGEIRRTAMTSLEVVKETADQYKVTPSAIVMRARRLGMIDRETSSGYLDRLEAEYAARPRESQRSPLAVNALRNYNGLECSRRMLARLDAGDLGKAEFCRVMFGNKLRPTRIEDFRAAVR